jgi:hypothetical protein
VLTAKEAKQLRHLLKRAGRQDLVKEIPGAESRGKGGFDYGAVLEPVEYCVRYLVRERGMKRRQAIREVTGTIWGNLSASARKKTSKGLKEFATRMEERLLTFRGREVTIKLPYHSFCFSLFASSILLPHSTTWKKLPWPQLSTAGCAGSTWYYRYKGDDIRFEERLPA